MWFSIAWKHAAVVISLIALNIAQDIPCRAIPPTISTRSLLCECTASHCDTITRVNPPPNTYQVYTTSFGGQRFEKSSGTIRDVIEEDVGETILNTAVLRLVPAIKYQSIQGFGGSVTDAASINWRKLSLAVQTHMINSYFSSEGLEYNLIRVPIGGSDFSTHPYTYNESPRYDHQLTNYSLTIEDYAFKIPMIHRSLRVATDEIKITASTWSPPIWMKTNNNITGFGQLKPEFYQSYADYHLKFIEEYDKYNIKIWAITTTNEPLNGIIPLARFNSLGWWPGDLGRWIANNLGPTIKNSAYPDTLIMAVDDQRYLLNYWMLGIEAEAPNALNYIDGIAVHYYGNFAPTSILDNLQARYPNKFLLATEACEGPMPWHLEQVEIGSWRRARRYTQNIMEDLNHHMVGWIDWNLCLDTGGGPNWAHNYVDAPILVYPEQDRFVKQPMFYAMGHFSKFIPRNSRRIHVRRESISSIDQLAVQTPSGNYVLVLHNSRNRDFRVRIMLDGTRHVNIDMEPRSIKTVEINPGTV